MTTTTEESAARGFRFPSAYTILFGLIIFVAILTWIVPAGQYERVYKEVLGCEMPVTGSYGATESNPQGFFDVILSKAAETRVGKEVVSTCYSRWSTYHAKT